MLFYVFQTVMLKIKMKFYPIENKNDVNMQIWKNWTCKQYCRIPAF